MSRLSPLVAALTLLVGCAHAFPHAPPSSSAASLAAPAGAPSPVLRALSSGPPLPGEPTAGWEGLSREGGRHAH